MGMRAIGIFIAILCLTASAEMMDRSGFNDELGVNPDVGLSDSEIEELDRSQDEIEDTTPDLADYLGFTVTAVTEFLMIFVVLNPIESGLQNIGFPSWFIFSIMNLIIRPLYAISAIQIVRGVVFE